MSKKGNVYLINNRTDKSMLLKPNFLKFLELAGYIKNMSGESNVEITEDNPNATLKKIIIQFDYRAFSNSKIINIWQINLEQEICGISSSGKTTEKALLVLQKFETTYKLNVILIELKSSLQDSTIDRGKLKQSTLLQCEEKLKCALNHVYFLLSLNNHGNLKYGFHKSTIMIKSHGLIVYSKNKITKDDSSQLYQILNNSSSNNILSIDTIINVRDKIKILICDTPNLKLSEIIN